MPDVNNACLVISGIFFGRVIETGTLVFAEVITESALSLTPAVTASLFKVKLTG